MVASVNGNHVTVREKYKKAVKATILQLPVAVAIGCTTQVGRGSMRERQ